MVNIETIKFKTNSTTEKINVNNSREILIKTCTAKVTYVFLRPNQTVFTLKIKNVLYFNS